MEEEEGKSEKKESKGPQMEMRKNQGVAEGSI